MRFFGVIAIASLTLNFISTNAKAAWTSMATSANWLAVEPNGERHVWKVSQGSVFERNAATNTWTRRDTNISNAWQIALPNDPANTRNTPYIIRADTTIWSWNGTAFTVTPGGGLAYGIAVSGTQPWVIGTDYNIYRLIGGGWNGVASTGSMTSIDVDGNGNPWIRNSSGQVFRWTGTVFQQTTAGDTAYSLSGAAIIKSSDMQFYFVASGTDPITWGVVRAPPLSTFPQMFARAGNVLWAVGDANDVYRCVYPNCF